MEALFPIVPTAGFAANYSVLEEANVSDWRAIYQMMAMLRHELVPKVSFHSKRFYFIFECICTVKGDLLASWMRTTLFTILTFVNGYATEKLFIRL